MPPITYQELFEKRQQGKDLHSRRFGEKKTVQEKDDQNTLNGLWKALNKTIKKVQNGKSGLNTGPLQDLCDNLQHLFRDPAKKQEHTDEEKQEYKWDKNKPVRPLTYVYRNDIENAICGLSGLEDYLGKRVDKKFTNAYNVIMEEASPEDSLIIEKGLRILNDVFQLDLPMDALEDGETCKSSQEKRDEWTAYKTNTRDGQLKREQRLEEWKNKAQQYELDKAEQSRTADKKEEKEIQEKTKKQIAEEQKRQEEEKRRREDEAKSQKQREEEERQRRAEARQKALSDRKSLSSNMEKCTQKYKDPNASPDVKKINMAMAAAFQGEIQRMGDDGENPMDEERVKRDMSDCYNSAAFSIAESKGALDELTALEPAALREKIIKTEKEVRANHPEGAPDSWKRAEKLFRQFDATWRVKGSSEKYRKANDAMRRIAEKEKPATYGEQYVAAETVKAYVAKNINRAKSATGRERMAISLAFLKQTMLPDKFQAYCATLDAQRRAAGDTEENRRIDPKCIGTVDEVYKETQERIRQVGLKEDGSKPDPRDLAMLTALSAMKKRSGGDKAVEQVTLLEEIEKVQASSEFKNAMEKDSTDELISKAFYGALNTMDGYAKPAPTGPVAEAQAKL